MPYPVAAVRNKNFYFGEPYTLQDDFTGDLAAGSVNGTAAVPGNGKRVVNDVESVIKTLTGRLRGGAQATAVWGDSRIYWTDNADAGFDRLSGRCVAAVIIPEDQFSDFAFGWDTAVDTTDPQTVGHGWLYKDVQLRAISPGKDIAITTPSTPREVQAMEYMPVVALKDQGAYVLLTSFAAHLGTPATDPIGIPQYPTARLLWIDDTTTTTPLYPYVSFYDRLNYPNGQAVDGMRIVDVASWTGDNYLATTYDRFTRADSVNTLGGSWQTDLGTWGISSNKAYISNSPGFSRAYIPNAMASGDGIVRCKITVPDPATVGFGLMVRREDANNFIRIYNDNNAALLRVQTWVAGSFGATIGSGSDISWTAGQTYDIAVGMAGNKYAVWVDGALKMQWTADANNRFLTATGVGLYSVNQAGYTTTRWDDLATYPHTVTLPTELRTVAVPTILSGGDTLGNDAFTDDDAKRLNAHAADSGGAWTEHVGTWTISSNRATCSTPAVGANYATQDLGVINAECEVDVISPGSATQYLAGIVARYVDANNHVVVRTYMDAGAPSADEVEIIETISGSGAIVHKANIKDYYAAGQTYTLKVQVYGDLIHVFLDDQPRISYVMQTGSPQGTRFGLYRVNTEDGCVFDNWVVKAL